MAEGGFNQTWEDTSDLLLQLQTLNSVVPDKYTNGVCTYDVSNNLTKVVFKDGATTVVTLDMTYDVSNNMLTWVTS